RTLRGLAADRRRNPRLSRCRRLLPALRGADRGGRRPRLPGLRRAHPRAAGLRRPDQRLNSCSRPDPRATLSPDRHPSMANTSYTAEAIEVLSGLDPVRKRPGMYTDTSRPNHLAQEVIDNSVDEALAGHARSLQVILHGDNSLQVIDDGRGMPVDIHPEEGVSGGELLLTKLHAGGKFSNKNYQFSGGLHGVGISVGNALSTRVEVRVRRDGNEYAMAFEHGFKVS